MATQLLIVEDEETPGVEAIDPTVVPTEDGGAIVDFSEPQEPDPSQAFAEIGWDGNLAEVLSEETLHKIGAGICDAVEQDDDSRDEWKKTIKEGMDLLGFISTPRDKPFPGACGVVYPLVTEAAIRFQARAIAEMFPEGGPVDCQILGEETEEARDQAERVRDYLNYLLTEIDEDYFDDYEQMLFFLSLQGSTFRKVWRDQVEGITKSRFILADDAIVSYSGERITHVLKLSPNEIKRSQLAGVYRDVDLIPVSQEPDAGPLTEKANEIEGVTPPPDDKEARRKVFETHAELEIEEDPGHGPEGLKVPYIVTVDEESQKVLAVRRNWREGDQKFKARDYFVHYKFFPGLGQYGYGYIHIAGGTARAITSILRQLVDAGQFANLPALIKAKGTLSKEQNNQPFAPGEIREVEVADPSVPMNQSIMPVPFKEPSSALLQMMNGLIESGNRLTNLLDAEVGDGSTQQAVGTVIALLEQSLQVQSAIRKRMHRAQRKEFRLLAEHEAENVPPEGYPFNVQGGNRQVMQKDFDQRIDIVPISDPKNFTAVQRMMQAEFVKQTAAGAPQLHDPRKVLKFVYRAGNVDADELLAPEPPPPYTGDVNSENMRALAGNQLQVRPDQDHESHCMAHLLMLQAPGVMMSPAGQILFRHAVDHELWGIWAKEAQVVQQASQTPNAQMALRQAQAMGAQVQPVQLPPPGQPMPPEMERAYDKSTAQAMQAVLAKLKAMIPMPPGQQDPAMVQAQTNAEDVKLKDEREREKLRLDAEKNQDATAVKYTELALDAAMAQRQAVQQQQEAQTERVMRLGEGQIAREHEAAQSAQTAHLQMLEGEQSRRFDSAEQERSRQHQAAQSERDRAMQPPPGVA